MNHDTPAYGLWGLAFINAAIFIIFAFSFFKPKTARDWRTFGTFSAFIVALFVEMYGFPLTIYLMSGWLAQRFPSVDPLSHDFGHLWYSLLGFEGDPHLNPIHILSNVAIFAGFILLSASWRVTARPIPREEPVTSATRPVRSICIGIATPAPSTPRTPRTVPARAPAPNAPPAPARAEAPRRHAEV